MKKASTKKRKAPRDSAGKRRDIVILALGRKPTREEIAESPLLLDEKKMWPWACKRYGKPFMTWVRENWITASEREIHVMHRAWIAAGGLPAERTTKD